MIGGVRDWARSFAVTVISKSELEFSSEASEKSLIFKVSLNEI